MYGCIKGRLYEVDCRNLTLAVYDGKGGFIGIRQKFGDRYLFTEYHYDQGPPYGTVKVLKDTEIDFEGSLEYDQTLLTFLKKRTEDHNIELEKEAVERIARRRKEKPLLFKEIKGFHYIEDPEKLKE